MYQHSTWGRAFWKRSEKVGITASQSAFTPGPAWTRGGGGWNDACTRRRRDVRSLACLAPACWLAGRSGCSSSAPMSADCLWSLLNLDSHPSLIIESYSAASYRGTVYCCCCLYLPEIYLRLLCAEIYLLWKKDMHTQLGFSFVVGIYMYIV